MPSEAAMRAAKAIVMHNFENVPEDVASIAEIIDREMAVRTFCVGVKTKEAIATLIRNQHQSGIVTRERLIEDLQDAIFEEHGIDFPVNT